MNMHLMAATSGFAQRGPFETQSILLKMDTPWLARGLFDTMVYTIYHFG